MFRPQFFLGVPSPFCVCVCVCACARVYIYILEEIGFLYVTTQLVFCWFIKLTTCFGLYFRPSSGHKI